MKLGKYCFYGCKNLTNIGTLEQLTDFSFNYKQTTQFRLFSDEKLISTNVIKIGKGCFDGCDKLNINKLKNV